MFTESLGTERLNKIEQALAGPWGPGDMVEGARVAVLRLQEEAGGTWAAAELAALQAAALALALAKVAQSEPREVADMLVSGEARAAWAADWVAPVRGGQRVP